MSIISSDAKWAVLQRAVRLSPEEIRGTTKSKEYEAGFIAGATRQPTEEEIEAVIGEVRKFIVLPGGYLENIIRIAFNAARRKATEE